MKCFIVYWVGVLFLNAFLTNYLEIILTKNKVTLEQLALLAGVSKATVSRVINRSHAVSLEVTRSVERAIKESGYVKKKNKLEVTLGFSKITIISNDNVTLPNSFFSIILDSLRQEAEHFSLELELILLSQLPQGMNIVNKLEHAQAIIVIGGSNKQIFQDIEKSRKPFIVINGFSPDMQAASISPDYEFGGFLAGAELLKLGHRKMKILTAHFRHSFYQRTDGFRRAIEMEGLPFSNSQNIIDLIFHAEPNLKKAIEQGVAGNDFGASQIIPKLIKEGFFSDCTAVFCVCDIVAVSLIEALKNEGIRVPEDISVIGFDGLDITQITSPPLTTICTDYSVLAAKALLMLIHLIDKSNEPPIRISTSVSLIQRKSTKRIE